MQWRSFGKWRSWSRYRRSVRAYAGIWLALALVVVLGACGGDDDGDGEAAAGDERLRIGVFLLASANAAEQSKMDGVKEQAKKEGNIELAEFDGKFDAGVQLRQVTDATASGQFDGFLIAANSGASIAPAVEDAISQGIKVGAFYEPIGPDPTVLEPQIEGLTTSVLLLPNEQAAAIGPAVIEGCEGKDPCNIAYIANGLDTPSENIKLDAFKESIADSPSIKIVATAPNGGFLREGGLDAAQDMLQSHSDIDGFVTSADQTTLGAEQAAEDAGRSDEIFFTGLGCNADGVKAVQEGRWLGSSCNMMGTQGAVALRILVKALRGEELSPDEVAANMLDFPEYPDGVDAEALEGFQAEW